MTFLKRSRCLNEDCSCPSEPSGSGLPPLWLKDNTSKGSNETTRTNRTECPTNIVGKSADGENSEVKVLTNFWSFIYRKRLLKCQNSFVICLLKENCFLLVEWSFLFDIFQEIYFFKKQPNPTETLYIKRNDFLSKTNLYSWTPILMPCWVGRGVTIK